MKMPKATWTSLGKKLRMPEIGKWSNKVSAALTMFLGIVLALFMKSG